MSCNYFFFGVHLIGRDWNEDREFHFPFEIEGVMEVILGAFGEDLRRSLGSEIGCFERSWCVAIGRTGPSMNFVDLKDFGRAQAPKKREKN